MGSLSWTEWAVLAKMIRCDVLGYDYETIATLTSFLPRNTITICCGGRCRRRHLLLLPVPRRRAAQEGRALQVRAAARRPPRRLQLERHPRGAHPRPPPAGFGPGPPGRARRRAQGPTQAPPARLGPVPQRPRAHPRGHGQPRSHDKVLHVDVKNKTVTVQAGIRVTELVDALREHGLTLQNFASIREQ
jgi:hypothetical protein